jgi:hypothetical protein
MTENKNTFPAYKPSVGVGIQKVDRLGSKTAPVDEDNVKNYLLIVYLNVFRITSI